MASEPEETRRVRGDGYNLGITTLGKSVPRPDIFFMVQEYGRDARHLGHLCVASKAGTIAIYSSDSYASAPRLVRVPLRDDDELVAGTQSTAGAVFVTAAGRIFLLSHALTGSLEEQPEAKLDAEDSRIVTAVSSTGTSSLVIGTARGALWILSSEMAVVGHTQVSQTHAPLDLLLTDYYASFVAVRCGDDKHRVAIVDVNKKFKPTVAGFVSPNGTVAPPAAEGDASGATLVSVAGTTGDLFITYSDGTGTFTKCYESSGAPVIKVNPLAPAPGVAIASLESSVVASLCPLTIVSNYLGGLSGGRICVFFAPEYEAARANFSTEGTAPADGRVFVTARVFDSPEPITRIIKLRGDASPAPWVFAVASESGEVAVVEVAAAAADAKWAGVMSRPYRCD